MVDTPALEIKEIHSCVKDLKLVLTVQRTEPVEVFLLKTLF